MTRNDIKPGHQNAQSGHAISQFILDHYDHAKRWNNNYLISLSIKSEEKLYNLLEKIKHLDIPMSYFTEPDINDELTSICFIETDETKRLTSSLPLSFKYD